MTSFIGLFAEIDVGKASRTDRVVSSVVIGAGSASTAA